MENEKSYKIKKLLPNVTLFIGDEQECCIYLVEGKERALLIDTGFGILDLKGAVESMTKLPYYVVNTHGHGDHTGGDFIFPQVYMHKNAAKDVEGALELNKTVLSPEAIARLEEESAATGGNHIFVADGFTFELGDKTIEVFEIPGHTSGCIALLDAADGVLFCGDCIVTTMDILLVVPQALSINTYLQSLNKLNEIASSFSYLCTGHDQELMPKSLLEDAINCCNGILDGTVKSEPLELPPVFGDTKACRATYNNLAISYRPSSLK